MTMSIYQQASLFAALGLTLTACGGSGGGSPTNNIRAAYTLTNSASGNAVAAFRLSSGTITPLGTFASGGNGTGTANTPAAPTGGNDPLGSQSALAMSPNKKFLIAVNAGSNSISSFQIANDGSLTLVDSVASGGSLPVSVAATDSRVYVANLNDPAHGVPSNFTGFRLNSEGKFTLIAGSNHALAATASRATSIAFSTDGRTLLSAERTTDVIAAYPVSSSGLLSAPNTVASNGNTPFGLSVHGDLVAVANAATSSLSTYRLSGSVLTVVSGAIASGNRAACWSALAPDGRHAYTANPGTNNLSTYAVATDGTATLQQAAVNAGPGGDGPLDSAVTPDGQFYVQLLGAKGQIALFAIDADGNLTASGVSDATLPAPGAQGLVVR